MLIRTTNTIEHSPDSLFKGKEVVDHVFVRFQLVLMPRHVNDDAYSRFESRLYFRHLLVHIWHVIVHEFLQPSLYEWNGLPAHMPDVVLGILFRPRSGKPVRVQLRGCVFTHLLLFEPFVEDNSQSRLVGVIKPVLVAGE